MAALLLEDKLHNAFENLFAASERGCYEDEDYSPYAEDLRCHLQNKGIDVEVDYGVSKAAVILPDSSYILKIPFNCMIYNVEVYNEATDSYEYTDEQEYNYFCNADDLADYDAAEDDYCENEMFKYYRAVDAGFGDFFLDTYCYGVKDGCPIYAQEKCTHWCGKEVTTSEHSRHLVESDSFFRGITNNTFIMACIDYYGEERTRAFISYLEEEGIDDLHNGNIGFKQNGAPCLCDWAGWRD